MIIFIIFEEDVEDRFEVKRFSKLVELGVKRLERRKMMGLLLLNILVVLYGFSIVVGKFVIEVVFGLLVSLSFMVRYVFVFLVFLLVLKSIVGKEKNLELIKVGVEFGGLLFVVGIFEICGDGGVFSDVLFLFVFMVLILCFLY